MWNSLLSGDWTNNLNPNEITVSLLALRATWGAKSTSTESLKKALIEECKKTPLVFLLDEAHLMDPILCRSLLNLSQKVRAKAPFLLVLAGTPDLPNFLGSVNATFSERATRIGIGRLDTEATVDAIKRPLKKHGITIKPDALQKIVEDSQQYPYFIQGWGKALWDEAKKQNPLT